MLHQRARDVVALRLAHRGWEVHAGVRRADDGDALRAAADIGAVGGAVRPVVLDVTDAAQVAALPGALGERLDAVVNNAGIVVSGPLEAVGVDDLRRQLDVNVVGQVAVTQAVLPLLREATGRVLFVGSVSGRIASPFMGAYNASKFALEGIADAMRMELRRWGIHVVLVEPGSIDTDLWRTAEEQFSTGVAAMSEEHRRLYGDLLAGSRKLIRATARRAAPVEKVVKVVEHAVTSPRPRTRYVIGADARGQILLHNVLPDRAFDAVVARMTGAG